MIRQPKIIYNLGILKNTLRNFLKNKFKVEIVTNVLGYVKDIFSDDDNLKILEKGPAIVGLAATAIKIYQEYKESQKSEGEKAFAYLVAFAFEKLDEAVKELDRRSDRKFDYSKLNDFIRNLNNSRKFEDPSVWDEFIDKWNNDLRSHFLICNIVEEVEQMLRAQNYESEAINGVLSDFYYRIETPSDDERIKEFRRWAEMLERARDLQKYLLKMEESKDFLMPFDDKKLHEYHIKHEAIDFDTTEFLDITDDEARGIREKREKKTTIEDLIEEFLREGKESWLRIVGVSSFGIGRTSMVRMVTSKYATKALDSPGSNYIPIRIFLKEKNPFDNAYEGKDYNLYDVLSQIVSPKPEQRRTPILLILDGLEGYKDSSEKLIDKIRKIRNREDGEGSYENMKIIITTVLEKEILEKHGIVYSNKKYIRLLSFSPDQIDEFLMKHRPNRSLKELSFKYASSLGLSNEITKPLFAWMLSIIYTKLKIFNNKEMSIKMRKSLIYMLFFYYTLNSKYDDLKRFKVVYVEYKKILRIIAALEQLLGDDLLLEERKGEIYQIPEMKIFSDNPRPIPHSESILPYFDRTIKETQDETQVFNIKFVHESFKMYLLAEYYLDSIFADNKHQLNIAMPSKYTMEFLDGLIEILNTKDQEIIREYVAQDQPSMLESFGLQGPLQEAINLLREKSENMVKKEDVILLDKEKKMIERPKEESVWIAVKTVVSDYKQLWLYRWISLFVLSKLPNNPERDNTDLRIKITNLLSYSDRLVPGYVKSLKKLNLGYVKNQKKLNSEFEILDLSDAYLVEADLSGTNLAEVQLSRANLKLADLHEADLSYADLYRANLIHTNLSNANLHFANLQRNDLYFANLSNANLSGANLHIADLSSSTLSNANLHMVNLAYSNISEAKLNNTLLIDVQEYKNLRCYKADFTGAVINNEDLIKYLKDNKAEHVPAAEINRDKLDQELQRWNKNFKQRKISVPNV